MELGGTISNLVGRSNFEEARNNSKNGRDDSNENRGNSQGEKHAGP
jgi:hypothetical protein